MKVHEFQAKQVLAHYEIEVPRGSMTESAPGAKILAEKILAGNPSVAVKAQIHAGGRGKAGGIKVCATADEAQSAASRLLGQTLVTAQTGPAGKKVSRLLIEAGTKVDREFYLAITLDRAAACPAIIASASGGMDIEEVARTAPDKIVTERVNPTLGLRDYQLRSISSALGLSGEAAKVAHQLVQNLFVLFMELDCRLAEINPLGLTADGRLVALDAKLDFDDSALYRHPEVAEMRDPAEEDPLEVEAQKHKLNYIKLDGNIGCMVNGAGLAMATMDLIQTVGLMPANFLDVGGGADQEMIENAFRILVGDPKVKGVLINIFGGILRCDVLARGIIEASKKLELKVPMVIRLAGTNAEQGRQLLAESGLNFKVAETFAEAADRLKEVMA